MNDAIGLLNRFVELWERTWVRPNDEGHQYIEYYQYAKVILATENNIQEDIAAWLLSQLDCQWDFDLHDTDLAEIDPAWAQLHYDIAEYLPGI